ncbi:hypothetical protein MGYG_09212 [Nannizzia gypsea CBS 118893]|uniref:Uncharacterized protein n=1 Tax=Arthroderma gypseum (strain ATCC MYA-4604 / CBS 118893) TaxID=535722 RepID=E4V780_ARTGP|nr:hypothetical protein MGYG_09212 [Nannizzia gypsea CBS 118893]EFQ96946.1 hypothetical protein MGYG_09212 [Nannizzia gypsea CBS 118893]
MRSEACGARHILAIHACSSGCWWSPRISGHWNLKNPGARM